MKVQRVTSVIPITTPTVRNRSCPFGTPPSLSTSYTCTPVPDTQHRRTSTTLRSISTRGVSPDDNLVHRSLGPLPTLIFLKFVDRIKPKGVVFWVSVPKVTVVKWTSQKNSSWPSPHPFTPPVISHSRVMGTPFGLESGHLWDLSSYLTHGRIHKGGRPIPPTLRVGGRGLVVTNSRRTPSPTR